MSSGRDLGAEKARERWRNAMLKFDHLTLPVSDWERSRDWYVRHLGMKVEFEIPDRCTAAVQDEHDFTIFLQQSVTLVRSVGVALYFQVADVEASFHQVSALGVSFIHPPRKVFWGYGAELSDPDGYLIRLWDQRSMKEKGES
jgi:catechol 2,3-dioxygenase-like lactoylglutathione lyase family enzyme